MNAAMRIKSLDNPELMAILVSFIVFFFIAYGMVVVLSETALKNKKKPAKRQVLPKRDIDVYKTLLGNSHKSIKHQCLEEFDDTGDSFWRHQFTQFILVLGILIALIMV
ncbi:MAG: hypothetical protein IKE33_02180 [Erysipelotrichaceae bacterium]|nr:hypothetical protein [Erysipelotrichaceae bacterium]